MSVAVPAEVDVDFLGVRTRRQFVAGLCSPDPSRFDTETVQTVRPAFDEEYFEWIDVLEAVAAATHTFTIIELGAGYGRWCVRAGAAVRRRGDLRFSCVAVEGEPQHFRWMVQHLEDNDIDPRCHELIWGAVDAHSGFVPFRVGHSATWYGQRVSSAAGLAMPDLRARRRLRLRSLLGRPPASSDADDQLLWVPTVTLAEILSTRDIVDLIDLDIQGLELAVLESSADLLARVRRVHIGTHSATVEAGLRELFTALGWRNLNDYACGATSQTPYGAITFGDGVQTWINPTASMKSRRRKDTSRAVLAKRVRVLRARNRQLKAAHAELKDRYKKTAAQLQHVRSSRLWRLMQPLRRIVARRQSSR